MKNYKKQIFIIFLFNFYVTSLGSIDFNSYLAIPKNKSMVERSSRELSRKELVAHLKSFVKCCAPNRLAGTKGHQEAIAWLEQRIKNIDPLNKSWTENFKPNIKEAIKEYEKDFNEKVVPYYKKEESEFKKWKSFHESFINYFKSLENPEGKNIVWEKKGVSHPNELLIIGAHFDSIVYQKDGLGINSKGASEGADNNASGVSVALSLIELLSHLKLPRTVRIVFFDYQEFGNLGSLEYLKKHKKELKKKKLKGFLNLDMLGHDSKKFDKKKRLGNMKIYIRKEGHPEHARDLELAHFFQKKGEKTSTGVRFEITSNGVSSGDQASFWKEGIPALLFSENWEDDSNSRRHNTENDFLETINQKTLHRSFRYVAGGVISWSFAID